MLVGAETITRKRFADSAVNTEGEIVAGASSTTPIRASVQPITGKELETLPEGERSKEWFKVYTKDDVRTGTQHVGTVGRRADHLVFDGAEHEVRKVQPWRSRSPIPHTKALCVRVQEG